MPTQEQEKGPGTPTMGLECPSTWQATPQQQKQQRQRQRKRKGKTSPRPMRCVAMATLTREKNDGTRETEDAHTHKPHKPHRHTRGKPHTRSVITQYQCKRARTCVCVFRSDRRGSRSLAQQTQRRRRRGQQPSKPITRRSRRSKRRRRSSAAVHVVGVSCWRRDKRRRWLLLRMGMWM